MQLSDYDHAWRRDHRQHLLRHRGIWGGIDNESELILGGTAVFKGNFKNGAPNDVENNESTTTISMDKKAR